jgi:hypothetical protein
MAVDSSSSRLRSLAGELRSREAALSSLEERVKEEQAEIRRITTGDMVDLMHELDVRSYELAADGNYPAMSFKLANHYTGSIPKEWPEPQREAAFDLIPEELIKITVKAIFAKGEARQAESLAEELVTTGYTVVVDKEVNHMTLKAWLRETYESDGDLPDLELINSSIFPEVKVKELKDD